MTFCLNDMSQKVNVNLSRSCGHATNVDENVPSLPSRKRAPSMQVLEDGLDRPPSSDFVTRAELRAHFVILCTVHLEKL